MLLFFIEEKQVRILLVWRVKLVVVALTRPGHRDREAETTTIGRRLIPEDKPVHVFVFVLGFGLTEFRPGPAPGLWGVFGTLCAPRPPSQLDTHPVTPRCTSSSNICRWRSRKSLRRMNPQDQIMLILFLKTERLSSPSAVWLRPSVL